MARKKKDESKNLNNQEQIQSDAGYDGEVKTTSVERTLEELLFVNVDYKDVEKLRKLRRINRRKHIDLIKNLKDCIKEAI
jgi:hypothetical protein